MFVEGMVERMREAAGIESVADLGVVHRGRMGHADCEVSLGIETWQGSYFVRVTVVHQKGRGLRNTRLIKWAYSRTSPHDLQRVLRDFQQLGECGTAGRPMRDSRGWFARGLQSLFGIKHLGEYELASLIAGAEDQAKNLKAEVSRFGKQIEVTLTESSPPKGAVFAQFPHAAVADIHAALAKYAQQAG